MWAPWYEACCRPPVNEPKRLEIVCSDLVNTVALGGANSGNDFQNMLNQRLLAASRDSDIVGIQRAIADGAYLETRRPLTFSGLKALAEKNKPWQPGPQKQGEVNAAKMKCGLTPLMFSSQQGSAAAVKLLVEAKAKIEAEDEDGQTALHFAARSGTIEVVELLLSLGAQKDIEDIDRQKPIDLVPPERMAASADRRSWERLLGASSGPAASSAAMLAKNAVDGPRDMLS
eukprot:gnl/TRDRNA2_/TRDRNA2_171295_c1_seq3.p1 gnl/TRDRNA2_/TRDRNA2_171295_c1~~gnl/TRDRNA2_/TRDRNA2_171295_c1_seq3.p1  ORF type:complete len:230 (+),score=40.44 gnl/TRDRNA2_/TRDRNA2_171295_c1_seq3:55-744(+)